MRTCEPLRQRTDKNSTALDVVLVKADSPSHRNDRVDDEDTNKHVPANLQSSKNRTRISTLASLRLRFAAQALIVSCALFVPTAAPAFHGFLGEMIRHCLTNMQTGSVDIETTAVQTDHTRTYFFCEQPYKHR